jgi:hypothetical protein
MVNDDVKLLDITDLFNFSEAIYFHKFKARPVYMLFVYLFKHLRNFYMRIKGALTTSKW